MSSDYENFDDNKPNKFDFVPAIGFALSILSLIVAICMSFGLSIRDYQMTIIHQYGGDPLNLSVFPLVLAVVMIVLSIAAIILSSIGIAKNRKTDFENSKLSTYGIFLGSFSLIFGVVGVIFSIIS